MRGVVFTGGRAIPFTELLDPTSDARFSVDRKGGQAVHRNPDLDEAAIADETFDMRTPGDGVFLM